jgi:uncharacterized membrane protein
VRWLGQAGTRRGAASSGFRAYARALPLPSLWVVSIACMAAAIIMAPLLRWADELTQWRLLGFGVEGARAVVSTLSGSLLSFIVFTFSMLLLIVQLAGTRLSTRVISIPFERPTTKIALGTFVFAYTYSVTALGRIEERVPQFPVLVVVAASLLSIVLFLYLIQSVAERLRPSHVLAMVADRTVVAIERLYPEPFTSTRGADAVSSSAGVRTLHYHGKSGVVVSLHIPALVQLAIGAGCRIEMLPRVGEFIAPGDPLCELHGPADVRLDSAAVQRCLCSASEQNMEQDPLFGLHIIVDIALKAFAEDVCDPATGVAAIDQLGSLLSLVGHRQLDTGSVRDETGEVRLRYRIAQWGDFVALGVTELHPFAGRSPQVQRRFRAMLARLASTLPEPRARYLSGELERLDRMADADVHLLGQRSAEILKRAGHS